MVQIRFEVSEDLHWKMQQAKLDFRVETWEKLMEKLMESLYGEEEKKKSLNKNEA